MLLILPVLSGAEADHGSHVHKATEYKQKRTSFLNEVPVDNQWRRFGSREIVPQDDAMQKSDLKLLPSLHQQGFSLVFSYTGQRTFVISRLIKEREFWSNLLYDEEVRWLQTWAKYKGRTTKNLVLVCDEDAVVYLVTKDNLSPVGEIRQKTWFKRNIVPMFKGVGEHGLTALPVHLILGLFGI